MQSYRLVRRTYCFLLGTFLCLSASGCLDFDRQFMVWTFSPEADEVQVLLAYEGLHVGGDGEKNLGQAKEELESLVNSGRRFYFIHPLFNVSLAPPKPGSPEQEEARRARELLQRHLTINKAALYLNPEGMLCASQVVRVREAKKLAEGMNEFVSLAMDSSITETLDRKQRGKDSLDEASLRLLQKAARDRYAWLHLEPGRISFTLPGTPKTFSDLKGIALRSALVEDLERIADPPPGQQNTPPTREALRRKLRDLNKLIAFLAETPISIDQRRDRISFSVGEGQGQPLRLKFDFVEETPKQPRKGEAELIHYAKTLQADLKTNVASETLISEFLNKHAPRLEK